TGVYAQRYDAAGVAQGSEFQVNTETEDEQQAPSIAMDADGDFVIAWQSFYQDYPDSFGIYAQRYDAAGVAQGSEFQVNTETEDEQQAPSVAMDADGDFVIAWQSGGGQDGDGNGVFAQRYAADGTAQGSEFQVNSTTTSSQQAPSVAMDADGDFVIAWQSGSGQDGANTGVFAQRYAADGTAQGSEFQVNTYTTSGQNAASVGMDADGDFVIAWQSNGQDGDNNGVFAQRYDAAGTPQGVEFQVNTYTFVNQESAVVAMDADGDLVVAWQSGGGQDGYGNGVFAQRYAPPPPVSSLSEVPAGAEFQVNTETSSDQDIPSVAVDADGDFVVVWESGGGQDGDGTGVYAQRYDADGVAQGSEFLVNTTTTNNQQTSSAGMDADGDFVIAWQSGGGQDGDGTGVYAQRYDAAGMAQGSEFLVNTTVTSDQSQPEVGMDADGDFVVVWRSDGQDGDGTGVYAQRYDAAGMAQGSEFLVNTYTTDDQSNPSVGMDDDGNFVVVWNSSGQDGANNGVYAQRFDAAGVAQGSEFLVNTYTTNNQNRPAVAMDADGDFVVVWQSFDQDGANNGVYAQRYVSDATPQGSEFQVNTITTSNQRNPSAGMDADGDFVIAWDSNSQDGNGVGVFAQRYALTQPTLDGGTLALSVLGTEGWRMLAQPNGTTLATLLASIWTQGVPDADVPNGSANVLVYDESEAGAEGVGFEAPATLAASTPGEGFIVFVFADDDFDDGENDIDGGFPKTLSAAYTAPAGTVSPTVAFTDNGTPDADGWNLLGNPFAEPLAWDEVRANAGFANVEATAYVWDPASNAYRTWNGSSGDLLGGEIAGGQGFFVKATSAGAAAPFASDDTGTIDSRTYSGYSRIGTPVQLAFVLSTDVGEARAFVEAGFGGAIERDGKDGYLLAPLSGTFAQVFTRPLTEEANADPLAINSLDLEALASSESPIAIPLGIAAFEAGAPTGGAMTLRWPETLVPEGWRAELRDTATGEVVDLADATEYAFTLEAAAQPDAPEIAAPTPGTQAVPPLLAQGVTNPVARVAAADRFELVLTPASVVATEGDAALPEALTLAGNYPNPFTEQTTLRYGLPESATVRVAVYDVLGREVIVVQDGPQQAGWHTLGVDAARLASGVYVWRVEAETTSGRDAVTGRMLVVK
ncbi:MAG: T9SS type A sorting domain-containing protein, partial [Bacteroidota bacterium]